MLPIRPRFTILPLLFLGMGAFASALFVSGCGGGSSGPGAPPAPAVALTLAGSATAGTTDGPVSKALFDNPVNVAVDAAGNVLVCDFDSSRVRRITPAGIVSTLTLQANFSGPFGIAIMPDGRLFVSTDDDNQTPPQHSATTGTLWEINPVSGIATAVAAELGRPRGLVAVSNSQIALIDLTENDVRIINPDTRVITRVAGLRGSPGYADGNGSAARFSRPYGGALTTDGKLLVADQTNNALRLITLAGSVTTFAGGHGAGYKDGPVAGAVFNGPEGVAIDSAGNVYVADTLGRRVRRITSGQVTTLAGNGIQGYADGLGTAAEFYGLEGIALNRAGTTCYVADGNGGDGSAHNRVRVMAF